MSRRAVKLPNHVVDPFSPLTKDQKRLCRKVEVRRSNELDSQHYLGTFALSIPDPLDYFFWEPESMTTRRRSKIGQKLIRSPKMKPPEKNLGRFIRPNGNRRQQRIANEIKARRVAAAVPHDPWNEAGELEIESPGSEWVLF